MGQKNINIKLKRHKEQENALKRKVTKVTVHNHNETKVTKYETNVDQASNINVDTTNFSQNLSAADDTVQKALETLDQLIASGGGAVDSVFGRTGVVVAGTNDYTWAQINKATSSLSDITSRSHTLLSDIGTNTHAQIDTHIADATKHRQINDAGTSNTDLRSAFQILDTLTDYFNKTSDNSDDITEGTVNKFMTTAEETKLSGIEALADVTDTANVTAAGAFMKASDDTDDIIVGATNKFSTAAEKTKLGYITITQAVDLDAIETRINELDASVILKGTWDASAGTFPGGGTAQAGHAYIVSVGGTVDGTVFDVNDRIIAITDNASTTTFAGNRFKEDYTDRVLSVFGRTGAVTAQSGDYTAAQITNTPAGGISATTVQDALNELDGDKQPIDADLTAIAALTPSNDDVLQRKSGAWVNRTIAQLKSDLSLNNVDNTSDATKNSASATLTNKTINLSNNTLQTTVEQLNTAISDGDIMPTSGGTFTGDIIVPDEAYGSGWDGNMEAPTKNALYDIIETLGGPAGIVRVIVNTSGNVTLGATADTDYIYFVTGAHTLSMPAPNTNRYTIKNNHGADITIDTAGAETIEGVTSISIAPESSVDVVSDGTNRFII